VTNVTTAEKALVPYLSQLPLTWRWSGSRGPLLPAAGSQYTAVKVACWFWTWHLELAA